MFRTNNRITRQLLVCITIVALQCQPVLAWSASGHHIIAGLAYKMLSREQQQKFQDLLQQHPQFEKEFVIPEGVKGPDEARVWLAGRAGYWPDVARKYKEFNRPTWHFQLGSSLVIGNADSVNVPPTPPETYGDANLQTQSLHIAQALRLCEDILADEGKAKSDRAIALCWIGHLVADAHQPCHAGSLYAEGIFAEGDRGANSIPTRQRQNLHALWDGLLGNEFSAGGVRRRLHEIESTTDLRQIGIDSISVSDGLKSETWLKESKNYAASHVYTEEVLAIVRKAVSENSTRLDTVDLPESYLKNAGRVSQERAIAAAYRLKACWERALGN